MDIYFDTGERGVAAVVVVPLVNGVLYEIRHIHVSLSPQFAVNCIHATNGIRGDISHPDASTDNSNCT